MSVRRDDTFRFSLQWQANTQERAAVGEFLDRLGNKKSDFIVMTIWEYLQQHPEAMTPTAHIKIMSQPPLNKGQVLTELKSMVTTYLDEYFSAKPDAPRDAVKELTEPSLSESALEDMLDNLTVFD